MPNAVLTPIFAILCCLVIAHGALQCFDPVRLKRIQDKLRSQHFDWSDSAGGAYFEKLREKQARDPSFLDRLSGLVMMGAGFLGLFVALERLVR